MRGKDQIRWMNQLDHSSKTEDYMHQLTKEEIEYFKNGTPFQRIVLRVTTLIFILSYGSLVYLILGDMDLSFTEILQKEYKILFMFLALLMFYVLAFLANKIKHSLLYNALKTGKYQFYVSEIIKKKIRTVGTRTGNINLPYFECSALKEDVPAMNKEQFEYAEEGDLIRVAVVKKVRFIYTFSVVKKQADDYLI